MASFLESIFGGGNNTSSSTQTIDPWQKGILSNNVSRAQGIADRPFESFMGQGYAPLSQNQRTAMTGAQNLNGAGAPAIDMGINAAGGLLGFNPQQISASTAMNPNAAAGMSQWQNPYTDQVVNSSLADIERSRGIAINDNRDRAIAARAFGGSRQGVADGVTNEAYGRIAADTASGLRAQGFNTAAGYAQQDAARGLNANQFNAGAQNTAAAQNQGADLQGAGLRQNASGLLGQLGQQQFNNGLGYVNALTQTGAMEQQTQQGQNQFDYNEFLRRQQQPYTGQGLINQSLGLLPSSSTITQTSPGESALPGLLGAGVKLLSAPTSSGGSLFSSWF